MAYSKNNYKLVEKPRVITQLSEDYNLELNLISWFGRESKYDIRCWDSNHESMSKGVSLTKEDLKNLKKVLDSMELD